MNDNNISEILKALAKGKNRSATARLREIFEEIEVALRSGVRRKDVHQALVENSFSISFASFELAIYRIRKEKRTQQKPPSTKQSGSSFPVVAKTPVAPGENPLRALSGKPKEGGFNPVPTAKFEVDNS